MTSSTEQTLAVSIQASSNYPRMGFSVSDTSVAFNFGASTMLLSTTHVQIGLLRLERELLTDIKLGTISFLQQSLRIPMLTIVIGKHSKLGEEINATATQRWPVNKHMWRMPQNNALRMM